MKKLLSVMCTVIIGLMTMSLSAETIRPGLLQAKNRLFFPETGSTGMTGARMTIEEIFADPTQPTEVVPGTVMADVQAVENYSLYTANYPSRYTGATYYWDIGETPQFTCTFFGYKGQVYLDSSKTYAFAKRFSDYVMVAIDGVTNLENAVQSEFVVTTYQPETTGWHDFEVVLGANCATDVNESWPWENKGPFSQGIGTSGCVASLTWGVNCGYGLAWNDTGDYSTTDYSNSRGEWSPLRDDDTGSTFRYVNPDEDVFKLVSVKHQAGGGYEVSVSLLNKGVGKVGILVDGVDSNEEVTIANPGEVATFRVSGSPKIAFVGRELSDAFGPSFSATSAEYDLDSVRYQVVVSVTGSAAQDPESFALSVNFTGMPEGITNELFVAYGPKDAGEVMKNWDTVQSLGLVDSTTDKVDFNDMPEGWGTTVLALRFFLKAQSPMPYWKKLAYVDGNGSAATFDTGCNVVGDMKMQAKFIYKVRHNTGFIYRCDRDTYSFLWTSNHDGAYTVTTGYYFVPWAWNRGGEVSDWKYYNRKQIVELEFGNNYVVDLDTGSKILDLPIKTTAEEFYPQANVCIMNNMCYGRLYYAKFFDEAGECIHDLIPVLDHEGIVALYDQETGDMRYTENGYFSPGSVVEVVDDNLIVAAPATVTLDKLYIDETPMLSKGEAGFVIRAKLESGSGRMIAVFSDGETTYEQEMRASVRGGETVEYTADLDSLPSDKTYTFSVKVVNDSENYVKAGEGIFYNGSPTLTNTSDMSMKSMTDGQITVSRADTHGEIKVKVAVVGGDAQEGRHYLAFDKVVTIPDGETSVVLTVPVRWDGAVADETTLTLALADGSYVITDQAPTATLTCEGAAEELKVMAYWPFSTKRTLEDASGNGNTLEGIDWELEDGAVRFNGSSTVMRTINGLDLSSCAEVTIEFFFKTDVAECNMFMEHGGNAYGDTGAFYVINGESARGRPECMWCLHGYTCTSVATAEAKWADGEWHHVAIILRPRDEDASTCKLMYIDDEPVSSTGYLNGAPSANHPDRATNGTLWFGNRVLYIGCRGYGSLFYNGLIDDIKVTNRALSPSEFMTERTEGQGGLVILVR